MKIPLHDILAVPTELDYAEPQTELNALLRRGRTEDYEVVAPVETHVAFYRAERDLFFDGTVRARVAAKCARCLEPFTFEVGKEFSVVLSPETRLSGEIELATADLAQSFYAGTEVDLAPLVYEQILLALPTRPLCAEECRGLCPQCGVNQNTARCSCSSDTGDPRLAMLRSLKIDRGA